MRIRKLELHGFKSFPDRTALHFADGISCVVGPNGCGKSNIVDAIKWCIGEQSAKTLRGGEMLDVIFAGSADRAPVGYAEVSLTFSAEGGEPFPGEYARFDEIEVGRRLHRNGTSEYLINKTRCRRRDIVDLFLDTGVGNNLYSFIEQGAIGKIVHATPEARRGLIDEAAGISRYKARREEAQARLEATATQLDRAADVADEMGRRLRTLERQVVKAARFRRVRALLRQGEIVLALAKYADLTADRRKLDATVTAAQTEVEAAERDLARREAELAERAEELEVVEAAVGTWRDEVAELDARTRELEGARGFTERRRKDLEAERERVRVAATEASEEREAASAEVRETEQRLRELDEALARAGEVKEQAASALEHAVRVREQARDDVTDREQGLSAVQAEVAGEEARIDALSRRREEIPGRIERVEADRARLAAASGEVGERLELTRGSLERAESLLGTLTDQETASGQALSEAEALHAAEASRRVEAERRLEAARKKVDAARSRLDEARSRAAEARERAASDAQREIERRVAVAQRDADASEKRAVDASRKRIREAEARASTWIAALERRERDEATARMRAMQRSQGEVERALRDGLAQAERTGEQRVRDEESAAREERDAAVARAREALEARQQELAAAIAALNEVDDARRALASEKAEREGALGGIRAQERALGSREGGQGAIAQALTDARRLADLLDLSDDDALAAQLSEHLLLPVVTSRDDVLRAAEAARREGRGALLWLARVRDASDIRGTGPGPDAARQVLDAREEAPDLAAALDRHAETGRPVVVRGSGERVDADGVVHLGAASDSGREAVRLQRERVALEARIAEITEEIRRAGVVREDRERRVAEARAEVARAQDALRDEERAGGEVVRARVDRIRGEVRHEVDRLRAELGRLVESQRRERDDATAADAARRDATLEDARRASHEAMEQVRVVEDAALEAERAGLRAGIERVREVAAVDVAQAQHEARLRDEERVDARAAELTGATDALEAARAEVEAARAVEADAAQALQAARASADQRRGGRAKQEVAVARLQGDVARLDAEATRLAEQSSEVAERGEALAQEAAELDEELSRRTERVEGLRAEASTRADALRDARERAREAESAEDVARRAASESHLEAATLDERAASNRAALAAAVRRVEEARVREDKAAARSVEIDAERVHMDAELVRIEADLEAAVDARGEAWDRLQRERDRLSRLKETVDGIEAAAREVTSRRDDARSRAQKAEVRRREVQLEIDALRTRMDERYQVSLPGLLDRIDSGRVFVLESDPIVREDLHVAGKTVEGVPDLPLRAGLLQDFDGIRARVQEVEALRSQLRTLGEVNLSALEEYREVEARHRDLEAQRADLEESVGRIRAAIAKMNRMCRQRFRDAFDRVHEYFQELYPRLVGGGSARLALTNEEDLLETGVDIFVQPPGKRLQNLTLLSGGEKAMTAIALLLALFQVKPSPFCLLDEVDAPLDEGNGARFNDVLREMSHICQFIVITHNRKSMEAADTLYGITMPTPGVSRLVSVKLGDDALGTSS